MSTSAKPAKTQPWRLTALIFATLTLIFWIASVALSIQNAPTWCTPDDTLCTSGQTLWGQVTWGSMLAFWIITFCSIPLFFSIFGVIKLVNYLADRKRINHLEDRPE